MRAGAIWEIYGGDTIVPEPSRMGKLGVAEGWVTPVGSPGMRTAQSWRVFGPRWSTACRNRGGKWQKSTADSVVGAELEYEIVESYPRIQP